MNGVFVDVMEEIGLPLHFKLSVFFITEAVGVMDGDL